MLESIKGYLPADIASFSTEMSGNIKSAGLGKSHYCCELMNCPNGCIAEQNSLHYELK